MAWAPYVTNINKNLGFIGERPESDIVFFSWRLMGKSKIKQEITIYLLHIGTHTGTEKTLNQLVQSPF